MTFDRPLARASGRRAFGAGLRRLDVHDRHGTGVRLVCIAFLNGGDRPVRDRFLAVSPDDLRLCSVVKAELLYGARHSAKVSDNLQT